MPPTYIPRKAIPSFFPLSLRVLDDLIKSGKIPVIREGRKVIVRARDIEAYLDSKVSALRRRGRPTKATQIAARDAARRVQRPVK